MPPPPEHQQSCLCHVHVYEACWVVVAHAVLHFLSGLRCCLQAWHLKQQHYQQMLCLLHQAQNPLSCSYQAYAAVDLILPHLSSLLALAAEQHLICPAVSREVVCLHCPHSPTSQQHWMGSAVLFVTCLHALQTESDAHESVMKKSAGVVTKMHGLAGKKKHEGDEWLRKKRCLWCHVPCHQAPANGTQILACALAKP